MSFSDIIKRVIRVFTRRAWLKALSLVLALVLWAYIVGNNTALTRSKTVPGISVNAGASTTLSGRSLALATDINAEYSGAVTAYVTVPQSRFSRVTASSVHITPDYTGINKAGTYQVPLTATCSYGTVTRLIPDSVTITVDDLDTRDLQVEVKMTGRDTDNYWYSVDTASINPQMVAISGPASVIQNIIGATLTVDVSSHTDSFRRSQLVNFTTADASSVPSKLVTKTSSTCSVKIDVYPRKVLEVSLDPSQIPLEDGYVITDITCVPSTIAVAADSELLESFDYLPLEMPAERRPASKSFTTRLDVSSLEEFKYISAKQVFVTVTIAAEEE